MVDTPFSSALENALYFRATDTAKNGKAFVLSAVVPNRLSANGNGGRVTAFLRIDLEGGFLVTGMSGSARGPVDANGLRLPTAATDFPAPGCTLGRADRGLVFSLTDVKTGRTFSSTQKHFTSLDPVVDAGSVLCPGYGFVPYLEPWPMRIYLPTGTLWQFTIENRDSGASVSPDACHRIDLVLSGERYVNG